MPAKGSTFYSQGSEEAIIHHVGLVFACSALSENLLGLEGATFGWEQKTVNVSTWVWSSREAAGDWEPREVQKEDVG